MVPMSMMKLVMGVAFLLRVRIQSKFYSGLFQQTIHFRFRKMQALGLRIDDGALFWRNFSISQHFIKLLLHGLALNPQLIAKRRGKNRGRNCEDTDTQ